MKSNSVMAWINHLEKKTYHRDITWSVEIYSSNEISLIQDHSLNNFPKANLILIIVIIELNNPVFILTVLWLKELVIFMNILYPWRKSKNKDCIILCGIHFTMKSSIKFILICILSKDSRILGDLYGIRCSACITIKALTLNHKNRKRFTEKTLYCEIISGRDC